MALGGRLYGNVFVFGGFMAPPSPYQPILLRLLHGSLALLTLAAWITGFWVYNIFDRRWGALPLPTIPGMMGIHGTIALTLLLGLPALVLYSFHLGDRRLLQADSLAQLRSGKSPQRWIAGQRLMNTLMLLAIVGTVITGRMMKEAWLPNGEVNRPWYLAHLAAWGMMGIAIALHLLFSVKVGGLPLVRSMLSWAIRPGDGPAQWLQRWTWRLSYPLLQTLEWVAIAGIALAFILPLFTL